MENLLKNYSFQNVLVFITPIISSTQIACGVMCVQNVIL